MENYVAAKFNITKNLTRDDCFIFDSDDDITIGHLDNIILRCKMLPFSQEKEVEQGAFLRDDKIVLRYEEEETDLYLQELALGGKHNIYNSMAAALAAKASGIDNEVIRNSLTPWPPSSPSSTAWSPSSRSRTSCTSMTPRLPTSTPPGTPSSARSVRSSGSWAVPTRGTTTPS